MEDPNDFFDNFFKGLGEVGMIGLLLMFVLFILICVFAGN